MEYRIEPDTASSSLPNIGQACLYWEYPRIFKAHPTIERATALKREWVCQRGGITVWGWVAHVDEATVGFCHFAATPFFDAP